MARIDEVRREIKENHRRIEELKDELWELEKEESRFYIYKEVVGNLDYWDEYYHQIGFVTTEKAKSLIDEEDEYIGSAVFSVDKETYMRYGDWRSVHRAITALHSVSNLMDVTETIRILEEKRSEIFKSLGLEYESFQHSGDPIAI